ncbi:hypothetical protein LX32DRAFT_178523 [Colletotrichum zoysiae]|uniref:Uncharacterized protein n=1 Tax=Colletotrichum zoysiae TaxID=1216348 RepID=A0AAD9H7I8_9PEZI|nr:hypothetical protein LX32DRAFT_178523 [Colletotrichum zoysiae]
MTDLGRSRKATAPGPHLWDPPPMVADILSDQKIMTCHPRGSRVGTGLWSLRSLSRPGSAPGPKAEIHRMRQASSGTLACLVRIHPNCNLGWRITVSFADVGK